MARATFAHRVQWLLYALAPHARPHGQVCFPHGVTWQQIEVQDSDVRAMFRRCVAGAAGGNVARVSIEEDLAVIGFVQWDHGDRLTRANLQLIKTESCDLETFYDPLDQVEREFAYLRLDLDRLIGPIFTHPYPHIHSEPHEGVRYSLNGWTSANPIVDFLEHAYLRFYHETWVDWARAIWSKHWSQTGRPDDENPFDRMIEASRSNQYRVLEAFTSDIHRLKDLLRHEKLSLYPLRADTARRDLLAYP